MICIINLNTHNINYGRKNSVLNAYNENAESKKVCFRCI